jgi:hypothetical protein
MKHYRKEARRLRTRTREREREREKNTGRLLIFYFSMRKVTQRSSNSMPETIASALNLYVICNARYCCPTKVGSIGSPGLVQNESIVVLGRG